jgi:hypothetical protein
MVKLSALQGRTVRITVHVGGVELSLKVRPNAMTPQRELELQEADGPDAVRGLIDFFCDFVAEWDLTDDDGTVLAIVPEVVAGLPSGVMLHVLRHAQAEVDAVGK